MNRREAMYLTVLSTGSIPFVDWGIIAKVKASESKVPKMHAPAKVNGGLRLSTRTGDIGQLEWAKITANSRKKIVVYLDDVEQPLVETADEGRGYIVRFCLAEDGDVLVAKEDVMMELVHGDVRIELVDIPI